MDFPDNLMYTKDHEWIQIDGKIATIGLTEYAQDQLGDIVFTDLPNIDQDLKKEEPFGVVESVKSVSDCLSPVTGKVIDINESLKENPAIINEDCYGEGWMIKVEISNLKDTAKLLKSAEYEAFVQEETA